MSPLLSIVIPTFNRAPYLEALLKDLGSIPVKHAAQLQVVISDNCSTDRTADVISSFGQKWPGSVKHLRRTVNIGMEGNIASAMMEGDGTYVWMLSDHQRLCTAGIVSALERLRTLDFDIGHAKILQWGAVLESFERVVTWRELSAQKRGQMLFALSNLSTLIFKKQMGHAAARSIFRACLWGFPHLGIMSRFDDSTRFAEFDSMSAFPDPTPGEKIIHGYDKIVVRYRSSLDCIKQMGHEARLTFAVSGFFTPQYRTSFRGDMLLFAQSDATRKVAWEKLAPVTWVNPWALKPFSVAALLMVMLLPRTRRTACAGTVRSIVSRWRARRRTRHA